MKSKKKHPANRKPADALNEGIRFDEQLKVKKEKKEGKLNGNSKKGKSNSTDTIK